MDKREARKRGEIAFWEGQCKRCPPDVPSDRHAEWYEGWDMGNCDALRARDNSRANDLLEKLGLDEEEFRFLVNYVRA